MWKSHVGNPSVFICFQARAAHSSSRSTAGKIVAALCVRYNKKSGIYLFLTTLTALMGYSQRLRRGCLFLGLCPDLAVCNVNFSRCTWSVRSNSLSRLICSTASIGVVRRWIIPKEQRMYCASIAPWEKKKRSVMQNCQMHICKNIQNVGLSPVLELWRSKVKVLLKKRIKGAVPKLVPPQKNIKVAS